MTTNQSAKAKKEVWQSMLGYEGSYEISTFGKIRSIARTVNTGNGGHRVALPKVLTGNKNNWGYSMIRISHLNKDKNLAVHRFVAVNFIPNPNNLPQVNHIDGDKNNNCVDNLEWCTSKENIRHAIDSGLFKLPIAGAKNKCAKPVYQLDMNTKALIKKYDFLGAVIEDGHTASGVSHCATGRNAHYKGFLWTCNLEAI